MDFKVRVWRFEMTQRGTPGGARADVISNNMRYTSNTPDVGDIGKGLDEDDGDDLEGPERAEGM